MYNYYSRSYFPVFSACYVEKFFFRFAKGYTRLIGILSISYERSKGLLFLENNNFIEYQAFCYEKVNVLFHYLQKNQLKQLQFFRISLGASLGAC